MKDLGYGAGYDYDHDAEDAFSGQDYFPPGLARDPPSTSPPTAASSGSCAAGGWRIGPSWRAERSQGS